LECHAGFRRDLVGLEVCDCAEPNDFHPPTLTSTPVSENRKTSRDNHLDVFASGSTVDESISFQSVVLTHVVKTTTADSLESNVTSIQGEGSTTPLITEDTADLDSNEHPSSINPLCPPLVGCSRQCSYGYKIDKHGCMRCRCHKCPPFDCTKKCIVGYVLNSEGCRLCKCYGQLGICI